MQEALGRALEHGGAGSAAVIVRYGAERVEVEVLDDGSGDATAGCCSARASGSPLYGGDLHAGPAPGGGHAVRLRLPVEVAA